MHKTTKYGLITLCCAIFAVIYYAWQQDWIIVSIPPELINKKQQACSKKQVSLYYFHEKWEHETAELLWSDQESANAQQLIQAIISLMSEATVIKKITVERVLSTHNNQQLLVFFDRPLLPQQSSIRTKLMIIESILKTLRDNNITTPYVYFLVNNQPLPDTHLDFSIPWPLQGFEKI